MINKIKHLQAVGAPYLFLDDSFWWTDSVSTATAVFKFRARRLTTVYPNYNISLFPSEDLLMEKVCRIFNKCLVIWKETYQQINVVLRLNESGSSQRLRALPLQGGGVLLEWLSWDRWGWPLTYFQCLIPKGGQVPSCRTSLF